MVEEDQHLDEERIRAEPLSSARSSQGSELPQGRADNESIEYIEAPHDLEPPGIRHADSLSQSQTEAERACEPADTGAPGFAKSFLASQFAQTRVEEGDTQAEQSLSATEGSGLACGLLVGKLADIPGETEPNEAEQQLADSSTPSPEKAGNAPCEDTAWALGHRESGAVDENDVIAARCIILDLHLRLRAQSALVSGVRQIRANELASRLEEERCEVSDSRVRDAAVKALLEVGPETADAVALRLEHHNMFVRRAATELLGKLGPEADRCAEAVAARLEDKVWHVREAAVTALGNMNASVCMDAILQRFEDPDDYVRQAAVAVLGNWGPQAAGAVHDLLEHQNVFIRRAAVEALVKMGPHSAGCVMEVATCLTDKDAIVRRAASEALRNMGSEACKVAEIVGSETIVEHQDGLVRVAALEILGRTGPPAAKFAELVVGRLEDSDGRIRDAAMQALGNMGREAACAIASRLSHEDVFVRRAAVEALRQMGAEATLCAKMAAFLLENQNLDIRNAAVEVIKNMGPGAIKGLKEISVRLVHRDVFIRRSALEALGHMGPGMAARCAEVLTRLSKDLDDRVRRGSAQLLHAVQNSPSELTEAEAFYLEDGEDVPFDFDMLLPCAPDIDQRCLKTF